MRQECLFSSLLFNIVLKDLASALKRKKKTINSTQIEREIYNYFISQMT